MSKKELNINDALNNSLASSITNLACDIADIGIDVVSSIIGQFVSIPVFSLLNGVISVGVNIRDKNLAKNIIVFLNKLNSGKIKKEKIEAHIKKLNSNPKVKQKEMDLIAILLDRFVQNQKAEMLAHLYMNYLKENQNWDDFLMQTVVLENFNIYDAFLFEMMHDNHFHLAFKDKYEVSVARLSASGLIKTCFANPTLIPGTNDVSYGKLTMEGILFYEYAILEEPKRLRQKHGL